MLVMIFFRKLVQRPKWYCSVWTNQHTCIAKVTLDILGVPNRDGAIQSSALLIIKCFLPQKALMVVQEFITAHSEAAFQNSCVKKQKVFLCEKSLILRCAHVSWSSLGAMAVCIQLYHTVLCRSTHIFISLSLYSLKPVFLLDLKW